MIVVTTLVSLVGEDPIAKRFGKTHGVAIMISVVNTMSSGDSAASPQEINL